MRGGTRGLVCAIVLVALCAPVGAQVVRWTDEQGEIHITEGLENVPDRHRGSAEVRTPNRPDAPLIEPLARKKEKSEASGPCSSHRKDTTNTRRLAWS